MFGEFLNTLKALQQPCGSEMALAIQLFSLVVSTQAKRVLEVGRWIGLSAFAITAGFKFLDEGGQPRVPFMCMRKGVDYDKLFAPQERILLSVDPDMDANYQKCRGNLGELNRYVQYVFAKSQEYPVEGMFDLIFIDGDHSYEACKRDAEIYMPHVRPGGFAVFHDLYSDYNAVGYDGTRWTFDHDGQVSVNNSGPMKVVEELDREVHPRMIQVDTHFQSFAIFQKPVDDSSK